MLMLVLERGYLVSLTTKLIKMPLQKFDINEKEFCIITPNKFYEHDYRSKLSKILLKKYGDDITSETQNALLDCHKFFTQEFSKVTLAIQDRMFYFFVFNLHEQSSEISYLRSVDRIELPVDKRYFAQYRRILKLILQESLKTEITENIEPSELWIKDTVSKLEELIFLGIFALDMVNVISENKFTGGSVGIRFQSGLYNIFTRSEWDGFFSLFFEDYDEQIDNSIVDTGLQEVFDAALRSEFNLDLEQLSIILGDVANRLYNQYPPRFCTVSELISIFKAESDSPYIADFISGLMLDRSNVAETGSGIYSAYNGNRLLHRPLLRIDIGETPCVLFDKFSFIESLNTLFQNTLTHGKSPKEWLGIPPIKKVMGKLVEGHKDILEDPVEIQLKEMKLQYDRNVKTLKALNPFYNTSINDNPGEIDFIFIIGDRIYIADCKNLTKRYEMHGFYQDLQKFAAYEDKMFQKLNFLNQNLDKFEAHLRIVTHNSSLNINDYKIAGVFIVNTPTLYAVNSKYKIYSFHNFTLLIQGDDVYDGVICVPDAEETEIAWPYIDNYKNYLNGKIM